MVQALSSVLTVPINTHFYGIRICLTNQASEDIPAKNTPALKQLKAGGKEIQFTTGYFPICQGILKSTKSLLSG